MSKIKLHKNAEKIWNWLKDEQLGVVFIDDDYIKKFHLLSGTNKQYYILFNYECGCAGKFASKEDLMRDFQENMLNRDDGAFIQIIEVATMKTVNPIIERMRLEYDKETV